MPQSAWLTLSDTQKARRLFSAYEHIRLRSNWELFQESPISQDLWMKSLANKMIVILLFVYDFRKLFNCTTLGTSLNMRSKHWFFFVKHFKTFDMNFCWRTLSEIAIYKSQCALKKNETVGINHLKLKIVYIKTYVEGAKYEKISTLMKWKKKCFKRLQQNIS